MSVNTPSRRARIGRKVTVAGLAMIYFLARILDLDRFVTSDEALWLGRSANFVTALVHDDPAGTFQFAHPGVMTMWSGALAIWLVAPEYASTFAEPLDYVFNLHIRLREIGEDPLATMVAARISKIALQTVIFTIAAGFLVNQFGRMIALIAGALIALDPFVHAIDSVLHVDGLAAICMVTAILALPSRPDLDQRTAARWALAGIVAGMAILTRWMTLVLFLPAGLMLLFHLRERLRQGQRWRAIPPVVLAGTIFTAWTAVTCLALWPALRHDPAMVFDHIWDFSSSAASGGHELPTYFLGTIYEGDPGPWFYPVALFARSTPVVVAGIVLLGYMLIRSLAPPVNLRTSACLITLAAAMTLVMTYGDKKFDRYLVSVNLIIMIFAAIGIAHAVRWLACRMPLARPSVHAWRRVLPSALLVIMIGGQLASTLAAGPYRFAYFNPLTGGTAGAETQLQLGWGEGMDEAARIILEDHEATANGAAGAEDPGASVRLTTNREQILYFLPDTWTVYPHNHRPETVTDWETTDYFVLSVQRWQRDLDPEIHEYLHAFEPFDSVYINGVEYIRIYKLDDIPPPSWLRDEQ